MGTQKGNSAASPKGGVGPKTKGTAQNARRRNTNRPPTRKIVRWNDDLDNKLLLSIQSACNTAGMKLPWDKIADLMGHGISEGAIVQHLAKLRTRMVQAGLEVPPPLRRGGMSAPSKLGRANAQSKSEAEVKFEPSDSENDARKDKKGKFKMTKKTTRSTDSNVESESEFEDELDDDSSASEGSDNGKYVAAGEPFLKYPNDNEASECESGGTQYREAENVNASPTEANLGPQSKIVKLRISRDNLQKIAFHQEMPTTQADVAPAVLPVVGNLGYGDANLIGNEVSGFNVSDQLDIGNIPLLPAPQATAQEYNHPNPAWMGYPQANITMANSQFFLPAGSWDDDVMTSMFDHVQADPSFSFGSFASGPEEQLHQNGYMTVPTSMSGASDPAGNQQDVFGQRPTWFHGSEEQERAHWDTFSSFDFMDGGQFNDLVQMAPNHHGEAIQDWNDGWRN